MKAARLAATGDPTADSIAASVATGMLELDAVLDHLSVPGQQRRRIPSVQFDPTASPSEQGRTAAAGIRAALGLGSGPLADVDGLIEQLTGVDVAHCDLGGVSGFCAVDPRRGTAVVLVDIAATETAERQRFTAAHELSHLVFPDDTRHATWTGSNKPRQEVRADEFARHLLIPIEGVRAWFDANVTAVVSEAEFAAVVDAFRVSPEVAFIQLKMAGYTPVGLSRGDLPTGRNLAYRHGRGTAFDVNQATARTVRPPVRLVERATRAYESGKLGLPPLANLIGRPPAEVQAVLADAGVLPRPRRGDAAVAAALAGHRMAGLTPTPADVSMVRDVVSGDRTADDVARQAAERLR